MAPILATAFIAIIALVLPAVTGPVLPRLDYPPPLGFTQGFDFLDLTFTLYAEKNCNGEPAAISKGSYGIYKAYQMQSYRLSRPLYEEEKLDFYSGSETDLYSSSETDLLVNNTIDHALDGQPAETCWVYDTTAGVDATTHDNGAESHGRHQGCHTLDKNEWCAVIWKTSE